jgi:predicted dehydrogenase
VTVIGISGIGSIGARHARVFRAIPGVRVIAHDPFADQQQILERIGSDVSVVGTFSELLDLGTDGVVLASPESAHVDQVLAATSRHLPVLVEKPIAATLPDAARLLPALPAPVLVGYVLRHYRCMISAAAMLRAGSVGTPVSFHVDLGAYETLVVARNRFEHAPAGTIYADYSHEWDYLRWWFGEIAAGCAVEQTVTSVPLVQRPNVVDALLRLAGGVTGTVHLDYLQDPGHRRITVVGDAGRLTIDAGTGMVSRSARGSTQPETIDRGEPRDHAFAAQAAHFLAVARGETEPLVGVADGIAALATAVALRRSAATGSWQEVPPAATVTGPSILRPPAG